MIIKIIITITMKKIIKIKGSLTSFSSYFNNNNNNNNNNNEKNSNKHKGFIFVFFLFLDKRNNTRLFLSSKNKTREIILDYFSRPKIRRKRR